MCLKLFPELLAGLLIFQPGSGKSQPGDEQRKTSQGDGQNDMQSLVPEVTEPMAEVYLFGSH